MSTACTKRIHFATRLGLLHFAISLSVAGLIALLIFGLWYPFPYRELAGGRELFWIIISVDVVCGPLLTLVLAAPQKSRREWLVDIGLVAAIQVAALAYGLYVLSVARPVALVFEVDRFRVVTAAEIDAADIDQAPPNFRALPFTGPRLVGIRKANGSDEQFDSMTLGLAGVEPSMRPNWWMDYQAALPDVLLKAKPIAQLRTRHPSEQVHIDAAIADTTLPENDLAWLPLVSRHSTAWVLVIDKKNGQPKAYLPLDGF